MTRADLRTAIQALGHGTDTVAAQNTLLSTVYLEIAARRRWSWLRFEQLGVTLTAGDPTTLVDANFAEVDEVRLTFGSEFWRVTREDAQKMRDWLHWDRDNGTPAHFAITKRDVSVSPSQLEVSLYPRPDKAYVADFYGDRDTAATEMDADGDTPPFDERFHPVLVWGAVRLLAYRQRDWNQYNAANAEYERYLREMEQADALTKGSLTVERWDGWDAMEPDPGIV